MTIIDGTDMLSRSNAGFGSTQHQGSGPLSARGGSWGRPVTVTERLPRAGVLYSELSEDERQIQAFVSFNKGMNEGHHSSYFLLWHYRPPFDRVVSTRFVINTASQDPLSAVGEESFDKILAAAKKYDPTGVFQTRAPGGWKITRAKLESEL